MTVEATHAYIATLERAPLTMEVYASPAVVAAEADLIEALPERLEKLWPVFLRLATEAGIPQRLGLNTEAAWELDLTLVDNAEMQAINREYRQKDKPTDVLTFTLLADAPDPSMWTTLPLVQFGGIFVSTEWARSETNTPQGTPEGLYRYLLARVAHGWLHLMGQNHDTMEDYEQVVALQERALNEAFA